MPTNITDIEFSLIRSIMRRRGWSARTHVIASKILCAALCHWDVLEPYYRSDRSYAEAEGLNPADLEYNLVRKQLIKLFNEPVGEQ